MLFWALEEKRITVEKEIASKACRSLEKMLELAGDAENSRPSNELRAMAKAVNKTIHQSTPKSDCITGQERPIFIFSRQSR